MDALPIQRLNEFIQFLNERYIDIPCYIDMIMYSSKSSTIRPARIRIRSDYY